MGVYRFGVSGVQLGETEWPGVVSITINPSGGEAKRIYADDDLYGIVYGRTQWEGTIECYNYPASVLSAPKNQTPKTLSWTNRVSNPDGSMGKGTESHSIAEVTFKPSSMTFETITDDVDAQTYSFDFTAAKSLDGMDEDNSTPAGSGG